MVMSTDNVKYTLVKPGCCTAGSGIYTEPGSGVQDDMPAEFNQALIKWVDGLAP